jgi:hypothetical protein
MRRPNDGHNRYRGRRGGRSHIVGCYGDHRQHGSTTRKQQVERRQERSATIDNCDIHVEFLHLNAESRPFPDVVDRAPNGCGAHQAPSQSGAVRYLRSERLHIDKVSEQNDRLCPRGDAERTRSWRVLCWRSRPRSISELLAINT